MEIEVKIHTPMMVEKKWGHEIWIYNDVEYCGKLLVFNKIGDRFSMHYHIQKKESWYIQKGSFKFSWIDTETTEIHSRILLPTDVVTIERGLPHQLEALEDGATVFEVSTEHFDEDSYRVWR
jgi:mannose-6-phosphate isomerase-like protein (cupin superfamily)